MKSQLRLEWVLTSIGVVFLAVALAAGWGDVVSEFRWRPERFVLATLLSVVALMAIAGSWAMVHPRDARSRSFIRYLVVQPAKHIPGGIAHPIGLISSTTNEVPLVRSTATFVRFSLISLASGLVVGSGLILDSDSRLVGVLSCVAALSVTGAAVSQKVGSVLESRLGRMLKRFTDARADDDTDHPSVGDTYKALAFGVIGMIALSAAFATLAGSTVGMPEVAVLMGAFGFAWSVGYAAIPIPAGIGVREVVLVAVLASFVPSGPVLAAALLQRAAQVLAEGLTVLVGVVVPRTWRRRQQTLDGG